MKINNGKISAKPKNILVPENEIDETVLTQVIKDSVRHWKTRLIVYEAPQFYVELIFPRNPMFDDKGKICMNVVITDEEGLTLAQCQVFFFVVMTPNELEYLTVNWKAYSGEEFRIQSNGSSQEVPWIYSRTVMKEKDSKDREEE